MRHIAIDEEEEENVLAAADIVIYGSFLEEQSFPGILIKAMSFGKPIVAPDLSMIKKYVCSKCCLLLEAYLLISIIDTILMV